jgi:uncharacterized membrane protein YraQ (UPF0718 family)/YHS domain-containing protein
MTAILLGIGHSLREAFFMFWDTLWALVLGFGLSGAVQAFVSREEMRARLGDHRPAAVARATAYGTVSSSCSYAASAMARSLFAKGADFISAMIFQVASTNLVVELGIVLAVLIGWQFAAAEYAGGVIMIVLLAAFGGAFLRGRSLAQAGARVAAPAATGHEHHGPGGEAVQPLPWRSRIRSAAGWADASSYTMSDLGMLRREMIIGYLVAGFLAELVPAGVWHAVFIHGHGALTAVENAAVGPFIALISFVCSIGNVPLAAALWQGGIGFGGVVSFLLADLIALPLVLIYRKFYGGRMALRLLGMFWVMMTLAGLATEALFGATGLTPAHRTTQIVAEHFSWNYTTVLNIVFLALFALLVWVYRNRGRLGGGAGQATDPVCGMQVERANAPASAGHAGARYYFCSGRCRDRFVASPGRYTGASHAAAAGT